MIVILFYRLIRCEIIWHQILFFCGDRMPVSVVLYEYYRHVLVQPIHTKTECNKIYKLNDGEIELIKERANEKI